MSQKYSEKVDLGNGDWGKIAVTEKQTDVLIGSDDKNGGHCHVWHDKEKDEVGIVHRGHCGECKDHDNGGK